MFFGQLNNTSQALEQITVQAIDLDQKLAIFNANSLQ